MPLVRSLPEDATYLTLFSAYRNPLFLLADFEQALMRGPSPLPTYARELIGAYVSGLNACSYCYRSHKFTAAHFGRSDEDVLQALLADIETASIDANLKPLFHYVRKLTLTPARMIKADADAVYAAGWDDTGLVHAVAVCAYFNFANRMTDGTGLDPSDRQLQDIAQRLASEGYEATITNPDGAPAPRS